MKRHALFVGVNAYDDKSIRPLRYSVPDATMLEDRLIEVVDSIHATTQS